MNSTSQPNDRGPVDDGREEQEATGVRRGLPSRRSLVAGGAGLAAGAAVMAPSPAAAGTSPAGHHEGFETRIEVAPGVRVNVADLDGGTEGHGRARPRLAPQLDHAGEHHPVPGRQGLPGRRARPARVR